MNRVKLVILLILMMIGIVGYLNARSKEPIEEIEEDEPQTKVALYFSNPNQGDLVKEYRFVKISNIKENLAGTILEELLKGPTNQEYVSYIPTGSKVKEVKQEGNKMIVNFSEDFAKEDEDEIVKLHKIYSVVNTLTEITEIDRVEIEVEGEFYAEKERL